jgi:redox-sensitive bicupin YhaK (pirin superfamily)
MIGAMSLERSSTRVTEAPIRAGMNAEHRARHILEPGHWEEYDPFLLLAEDWFPPGTFGPHPHRGFETVTLVLEGQLKHQDNHGGEGVLGPGDAQWMTAGRGIIHIEDPVGGPVHSLQLWLNLPASRKLAEPSYQDLRGEEMPVRQEAGAILRVFSGTSGNVTARTSNHVPVTMVEIRAETGASVVQELAGDDNAFIYVVSGSGRFGAEATPGRAGQAIWFGPTKGTHVSNVTVHADSTLHAVLWAGPPLGEPVVARGPFVMNSEEQLVQAYADYRAGRF